MNQSALVTSAPRKAKTRSSSGIVLLVLLAVIGLVDSTYLSINHFSGAYLACSATGGCEEVLGSEFSALGPIPFAVLGAFYYATVLGMSLASLKWRSLLLRFLPCLTLVGLGVSIYLVWLQTSVLQAFCAYCMLSAGVCLSLFAVTMALRHRRSIN